LFLDEGMVFFSYIFDVGELDLLLLEEAKGLVGEVDEGN